MTELMYLVRIGLVSLSWWFLVQMIRCANEKAPEGEQGR